MRPTPAELIDNVRRILRDVVEPAVESEYASSRLREVRAVLAQVDWNDTVTALSTDNISVAALLQQGHAWLLENPSKATGFDLDRLGTQLPASSVEPFAVHNARSAEFAVLAIELADQLADAVSADPADQQAAELLQKIRYHYSYGSEKTE